MRVRLIYAKRHGACFVPHIALAQIFSRSATRAGFRLVMTQGFSPRPKLSFGPELPAGVVALNEPVDMYFADDPCDIVPRLNTALPEGFSVSEAAVVAEDAPSLGKSCRHAEYLMRTASRGSVSSPKLGEVGWGCTPLPPKSPLTQGDLPCEAHVLADLAADFFGPALCLNEHRGDWQRLILSDPAQNPIGGFVKSLIKNGVITGWHEANIVRISVGTYNPEKGGVSLNA